MGGLSPPAAMATRRLLRSAQNRCHMSQDECGGGGEHWWGRRGVGEAFVVKWSHQREWGRFWSKCKAVTSISFLFPVLSVLNTHAQTRVSFYLRYWGACSSRAFMANMKALISGSLKWTSPSLQKCKRAFCSHLGIGWEALWRWIGET